MKQRDRAKAALLPCLLCLALLQGCGSSQDQTQTEAIRGPQPPKGASPLLEGIYRSFQPPQANPQVKGSEEAIEAGERACGEKTPTEVKEAFIDEAKLTKEQREALEQLKRAEEHPSADFVAGQLAGLVYEASLEGEVAEYGYRGCVYALAQKLKRELGRGG
jgi:hypothetical protein